MSQCPLTKMVKQAVPITILSRIFEFLFCTIPDDKYNNSNHNNNTYITPKSAVTRRKA